MRYKVKPGDRYPSRTKRTPVGKKHRGEIRLLCFCSGIILVVSMLTMLGVKYSDKVAGDRDVARGERLNTSISERIELYDAEIERMTSEEVISELAREYGLVKQGKPYSVVIPGRN